MLPTNPLDAWTAQQIGSPGALLTRADLAAYQLRQLRQTLAWAKAKSPFYRHRLADFDAAGLSTLDALRELPFTTADDLRTNDPPLLCVSQSEVSRIVTLETSATSGPAKRIFFTAQEQAATLDFFDHGMRVLAQPGDRVLILFPGERPGSVGELLAQALSRQCATPIAYGWPQDLAAAAAALRRERTDVVVGAPVPLLAVARYAAATGQPVRVRSVLLSADQASAAVRRCLAQLWGCEIFEHYGMTEMGLGGGVDCAAHAGYHLRESELLVEIVDPVSGEPVADGEPGEVVFTTLTRRGMPLVRYRSGDISRRLPGPCACGSPLTRLGRIERRVAAGVDLGAGGTLTIGALDEALLAIEFVADFVPSWRSGPPPSLHVEVTQVARVAATQRDTALVAEVSTALAAIPPIAAAMANGLQFSVSIARDDRLPGRVGKRSIVVEPSP
ncbi:MAG: putative adenylyltransferase [Proteobacteria bacterium]|nr:putative adenylyltransferase [Pseudomonadota bacterium]